MVAAYVFEVNESLKEEVKVERKNQRRQAIESLSNQNIICRLAFKLFRKDFIKKMESRVGVPVKHSLFFKIISKIIFIKL